MQERVYDFCPKCGALMLNGVCQSCGHKEAVSVPQHSEEYPVSHAHTADEHHKKDGSSSYQAADVNVRQSFAEDTGRYDKTAGRRTSGSRKTGRTVGIFAFVCVVVCLVMNFSMRYFVRSNLSAIDMSGDTPSLDLERESDPEMDEKVASGEQGTAMEELFDTSHKNHFGESFDGDYYERFCDYIDESSDYEIRRESYEYQDQELDAYVNVSYIQLESDTIDVSAINEALSSYAQYFKDILEDKQSGERMRFSGNRIGHDAYVTYSDSERISVVTYAAYSYDGQSYYTDLYCVNFDLLTGTELFPEEMLDYNDAFVDDWIAASKAQNGTMGAPNITKKSVKAYLNSTDCIAFYTPMGMEVGYSYYDEDSGSDGWVTVTVKDYGKYTHML